MTQLPSATGPNPPPRAPIPIAAIAAIAVVALAGVAMLAYALFSLASPGTQPGSTPVAQGSPIAAVSPTRAILIPTVTSAPPTAAPSDTPAATDTAPAADTPTEAATTPTASGPILNILLPANVRAGPGVNYTVLGGLQAGSTPEVLGRDSSGTWYVVNYLGSRGWVSNQVAQYSGDTNALTVIAAPPPPATATAIPPTATSAPARSATPAPSGNAFGIRVDYFFLSDNITQVLVGQPFQFKFKITNTSGQPLYFGGMGAIAMPNGPAQPSWEARREPIPPNGVLEWEDNMTIRTAGDYKIHLGICMLESQPACENPAGWTLLSSGISLAVR
jgi:hypothetical protein